MRLCPNGREWLERRTVIHLYEDITAAPAFIVCQIMSNHLESNTQRDPPPKKFLSPKSHILDSNGV